MKHTTLLFLLLFLMHFVHGQQTFRGKVTDINTKESLAFANIQFNHDPKMQVTSDINGNFNFELTKVITNLKCSYVGYDTMEMTINETTKFPIQITLTPKNTTLDEIIITQNENPAFNIIRKTIANKERNNPENIGRFRYQCYNKINVNLSPDTLSRRKNNNELRGFKGNPFFLMESVTKRKYIAPNISEEVVIASRVSGLKNPAFASLATDLQPFAFYQDNIKLVNVYYLNPISEGSLKKYKFRLEETFEKEKDTVFVISFEPKQNKNFDGLKGVLYINSNQYAIQNVIATPNERAKINLKIQQQYQYVNNKYWFPEQLNYSLTLDNLSQIKMLIDGKSYIDHVEVDIPLEKKDFSYEIVRISENATKQDSSFWESSRHEKLTQKELATYQYLDSLGLKKNFDGYMKVIEKFSQNKLSYHFIDFDLSKTFRFNKYEGTRLGTGIYTNDLFVKNFVIGGFGGYGIKDHQWKYGGEASYFFDQKKDFSVGIKHQSNITEIGNYGLRNYSSDLFNLRSLISGTFDEIKQNSFVFKFRTLRYLTGQVSLNQTVVSPLYPDLVLANSAPLNTYKTADISFFARYAFKEKIAQIFGSNTSLGSNYPIVYLLYTHGLKNIFGSQLEYNKLEIATEHSFFVKNFGKTRYRLETGYIDTSLPLGLLFTGEGSLDSANPYIAKNTFQTMMPYEFVSDSYINLFLSHNFGTLLLKTSYFEPCVSIHQNLSWGKLDYSDLLSTLPSQYESKENVFLEAGIQADNIIKLNMLNVGYFGIGAAVFHRYGYYSKPDFHDNMAYKITFSFTIK